MEDKEDLEAMMEAEKEYRITGGRLFEDVVGEVKKQA